MSTAKHFDVNEEQRLDATRSHRLFIRDYYSKKSKAELVEMLVEQREVKRRNEKFQTTLQFHIQHDVGIEDALNELLWADEYKCNVFDSISEDYEDMIVRIETNSRADALKWYEIVEAWCMDKGLMVSQSAIN